MPKRDTREVNEAHIAGDRVLCLVGLQGVDSIIHTQGKFITMTTNR